MTATDSLGLVGMTIDGKYVVESVVGEGGFGVVYRAMHKLWQKPVALKCFKTLMDASPAMREQLLKDFIQEGALLSELSARSASIVQARDVATLTTPSGAWVPYMVLEWLEGETLDEYSERVGMRQWSLEDAMSVLEPVALALDVAHTRHIAHRDIKPANIFIVGELGSDHMLIKLLDFGIAKVVQSAADHGFTKTQGQLTAFTPSYGAPEQFTRSVGATGPWTDVYALALILVELLAGRYALDGEDFIQLGMSSSDRDRRPTPRTLGVDLGDAIEAVMTKAVAIKPTDRYQTAAEFWNALRGAIGIAPLRRAQTADPTSGNRLSREAFAATSVPASVAAPPMGAPNPSTLTPNIATSMPASQKKFPLGIVLGGAIALAAAAGIFLYLKGASTPKADGGAASSQPASASSGSKGAPPVASSAATPSPSCPAGMLPIPGGQFFMGSDEGDHEEEKPAHNVTLSPYCIDEREVTTAQYKACSDEGKCKRAFTRVDWPEIKPESKELYSPLCNANDPKGKAEHPINCVDWDMATIYCTSHGGRLPTEAEWEFAARGPDGRIYPWGDEAPDQTRLNACDKECAAWGSAHGQKWPSMFPGDDGFASTAPVGSFPAGKSRDGLLDVVGNVWEWTADWMGPYDKAALTDPKGPEKGDERVMRGGAWNGSQADWLRPSYRYSYPPEAKTHVIGFRCAKSMK